MNTKLGNSFTLCCFLLIWFSCNYQNPGNDRISLKKGDSVPQPEVLESKKLDELGFELMKNESIGEIRLGIEQNKILKLLGEPDYKSNSELWGADGEYHQEWKYQKKGINLGFVLTADSSNIVDMITILEPCTLKTKRNIGIGNSIEDVQIAYKQVIDFKSSNNKTIIAGTVYGGMIFSIENKIVKSIFIGAEAE
jgi:hypothetical protein